MTLSTSVGAKPAPLPIILTNRDSRLIKAAIAVTEAKERNLDDKAMWRPLHGLWEREMKRACSSYRPLKGEYFGTLCDSGREGAPACSHCGQCQFFSSLADSKAIATDEARARLRAAAMSAGLLVNITPPAPVATVVEVDAREAAALTWEAAALVLPAEAIEEWLPLLAANLPVPVPVTATLPDVPASPRYKDPRQSKHARRIAELQKQKQIVKNVPVRKHIDEKPVSLPVVNMAAVRQQAAQFADLLRQ
jgi:hypothetical protein